jgi:hypothetical protein
MQVVGKGSWVISVQTIASEKDKFNLEPSDCFVGYYTYLLESLEASFTGTDLIMALFGMKNIESRLVVLETEQYNLEQFKTCEFGHLP